MLGVLGGGCSSGESDDGASETDLSSPAAAATRFEVLDATFSQRSIELADQLGDRLGGDDDATDALILALDAGYSTGQVLAGVESATLSGDGSIDGESPAGPPLGAVASSDAQEGEESLGGNELVLVVFAQSTKTPIERMRERAQEDGTKYEVPATSALGYTGTRQIMQMFADGLSADQIFEALLFGVDEVAHVRPANSCSDFEPDASCGDTCATYRIGLEVIYPPPCEEIMGFTGSIVADDVNSSLDELVDDPTSEPDEGPDPGSAAAEGEDGESGSVYSATFVDLVSLGEDQVTSVLQNEMTVDLSGEVPVLQGVYRFQIGPDNFGNSADEVCEIEIVNEISGELTSAVQEGSQWTGTVSFVSGAFDGTCSAGSQANEMGSQEAAEISFEVSGDVLTGRIFDGSGVYIEFGTSAAG